MAGNARRRAPNAPTFRASAFIQGHRGLSICRRTCQPNIRSNRRGEAIAYPIDASAIRARYPIAPSYKIKEGPPRLSNGGPSMHSDAPSGDWNV